MTRGSLWLGLALVTLSVPGALAAGRVPYGGDLLVTTTAQERQGWQESLSDCRLFKPKQPQRGGSPVELELARSLGSEGPRSLRLSIVGGASFHDGTPIQAQHVVASLERVRSQTSSLRSLFKQLRFDVVGDLDIRVGLPRGMQHETLRHLLAHPDAAIRNQASGCGAFRRTLTAALEERYEAHAGHPRGRPWLDSVRLIQVPSKDDAEQSLVFEEADLTIWPSHRYPKRVGASARAWSSVLAIPGRGFRGDGQRVARQRFASLIHERGYGHYLDAPSKKAEGLLPPPLARGGKAKRGKGERLSLLALTVAYPAGREDLAEIAQVVLGRVGRETSGERRVLAVDGLDLARARSESAPWDIALVDFPWRSLTRLQGALELADAAGFVLPIKALHSQGRLTRGSRPSTVASRSSL